MVKCNNCKQNFGEDELTESGLCFECYREKKEAEYNKIIQPLIEKKKLFKYNLEVDMIDNLNLWEFYKLKNIEKNKFIGSWKTASGCGMFSEFLEFTEKKSVDESRFDLPEFIKYPVYKGNFDKKLNIIKVPMKKKLELCLLSILLCPTVGTSENLLLILNKDKNKEELNCIFCEKEYSFTFYYALDEYLDEFLQDMDEPDFDEEYNNGELDDENDNIFDEEGDELPYIGDFKYHYSSRICFNCIDQIINLIDEFDLQLHGIIPKRFEIKVP
ncbi:MAG: hypothetical protein ACTSRG_24780 [Candidatus Helarchaeota archaeon]